MQAPKQTGFTLIEISIVLVIIGLLAGGILKGQQMIENAKYKAWVKQIDTWRVAINTFRDTYKYLPGDYPYATTKFTKTSNIAVSNGNGNGIIDHAGGTSAEYAQSYVHILQAGLVSGDLSNIPTISGSMYLQLPTGAGHGFLGGFATFLNPTSNTRKLWMHHHNMQADFAKRYDEEFDDGKADSGDVVCYNICSGATWPNNNQLVSVFIAI